MNIHTLSNQIIVLPQGTTIDDIDNIDYEQIEKNHFPITIDDFQPFRCLSSKKYRAPRDVNHDVIPRKYNKRCSNDRTTKIQERLCNRQ